MSLQEEMLRYAKQAGGSLRTREHRERTARGFCRFLRDQNIQTRHVREIRSRQIQAYVSSMQQKDLNLRTMQNSLAALRTVLTAAGRERFAQLPELSNRALGLAGASRDGTHAPVDEALFRKVREGVSGDDRTGGIAAVLDLQWVFGLRALEALCVQRDTLKRWALEVPRGKIEIIKGTKGGRPRLQTVLAPDLALATMEEAQQVMKLTGEKYLVIGQSRTLKSAYDRYQHCVRKHGLRGKLSCHALRYSWTAQAVAQYGEEGFSDREALQKVSQDLGHGDGRGRYVKQVYYQKRPVD